MESMTLAQWAQIGVGVVSVLAALVGIAGALVAVFWRGAKFTETITKSVTESERRLADKITESEQRLADKITESEQRLRAENADKITESEQRLADKITESEQRLRAENHEAHAAIGTNINRLSDQLGAKLDTLATDVAVLRGRQEERDLRGEN